MKVKMLSTQKGTLNNGLGNISTWYLEGKIYDAPIEDAEYWIKKGLAVAVVDEVVCENKKYIPKQNKENEDTVKVSKQYGKKGKIRLLLLPLNLNYLENTLTLRQMSIATYYKCVWMRLSRLVRNIQAGYNYGRMMTMW